jgi:hypothetical protein
MFKFLPRNPDSAWSVIAAGFKLYFSSFKYSLSYAISMALTLTIIYVGFDNYTTTNDFTISLVATLAGLVFFIPLVKRIYSVGADLPITTQQAFNSFIWHYARLAIIFCLLNLLSIAIVIIMGLTFVSFGAVSPGVMVLVGFLVIVAYFYILLKIYFANMFVLLENQNIWQAFKSSIRIEHHHMWLTFWVIFLFIFLFTAVITFINPYFNDMPNAQIAFNAVATIIGFPLFVCVQICQFFNLKQLSGD